MDKPLFQDINEVQGEKKKNQTLDTPKSLIFLSTLHVISSAQEK